MDTAKLPKHIAIFPDGDRRWARNNGLSEVEGYRVGVERLLSIVKKADSMGIENLTFWGFSTENWTRAESEVSFLMNEIFIKRGSELKDEFIKTNARFKHIGRKDRLPSKLSDLLNEIEEKTAHFEGKTLTMAIDYGGRDEIIRAVKKIVSDGVKAEDIDDKVFSSYLDTVDIPDPDMIIRTSGEQRMSGFMPWQTAYAELFFLDTYFPDFTDEMFEDVVMAFGNRERRFGGK